VKWQALKVFLFLSSLTFCPCTDALLKKKQLITKIWSRERNTSELSDFVVMYKNEQKQKKARELTLLSRDTWVFFVLFCFRVSLRVLPIFLFFLSLKRRNPCFARICVKRNMGKKKAKREMRMQKRANRNTKSRNCFLCKKESLATLLVVVMMMVVVMGWSLFL
jgi:hypothetical protein